MATTLPAGALIRLRLTSELLSAYELQAADLNVPLEELLESRLVQMVAMRAVKPLFFSDEDRIELESLLGKNVNSPIELIRLIRNALSVRISGKPDVSMRVDIKPNLLTRLRSRCFGKPFEDFLKQVITEGLETYVGLR